MLKKKLESEEEANESVNHLVNFVLQSFEITISVMQSNRNTHQYTNIETFAFENIASIDVFSPCYILNEKKTIRLVFRRAENGEF